jgi:hypothetical protein
VLSAARQAHTRSTKASCFTMLLSEGMQKLCAVLVVKTVEEMLEGRI